MRKNHKVLVIGVMLFSLMAMGGCTTPTQVPLTSTGIQNIKSVDAYIYRMHDELYAQVESSNAAMYTGGGLVGALIEVAVDSSRAKTAENLMEPIRDGMVDYDYGELTKKEFVTGICSVTWLKLGHVELLSGIPKKDLNRDLKNSEANTVLVIGADCSFSPDFKTLNLIWQIHLLPKSDGPSINFEECLYKNIIVFTHSLEGVSTNKNVNVNTWAENNAGLTKQTIEEGTKYLAERLGDGLKK